MHTPTEFVGACTRGSNVQNGAEEKDISCVMETKFAHAHFVGKLSSSGALYQCENDWLG